MNQSLTTYRQTCISTTFNGDVFCFRFNGKEKDHESGLHYYGARYYWSEALTGWLNVDPIMDKYFRIEVVMK